MPVFNPQMRIKLAKSAFELFAQKGIKSVTLDEVAAHTDVTKGSLYWHYRSKKELILAACTYYFRCWQQKAHREIARDNDPLKQLENVLRFSVQSCLFDKANRVFTTEIFALSLQDDDIRLRWAQFYDTVRELHLGLVQAACTKDRMKVRDARSAVDWMLVAIEGIKQRASFEPEICTPDKREAIIRGLLRIVSGACENPSEVQV